MHLQRDNAYIEEGDKTLADGDSCQEFLHGSAKGHRAISQFQRDQTEEGRYPVAGGRK